jgi:hypothetical protein
MVVANKTRVSATKVRVNVEVQTLSFYILYNINGGSRVRSETSVCMTGFYNFSFIYEISIDV